MDVINQVKEALELGLETAQEVAHDTHQKYAGYKPERHAAVDADVQKIKDALAALASLEAAEPVAQQPNAEAEQFKRMFMAAAHDLGEIHDALGLDPDDAGGAEPIIDAIEELKATSEQRIAELENEPEIRAELDRLLNRVANTSFACGAFDSASNPNDYLGLTDKASAAREELKKFVLSVRSNPAQQSYDVQGGEKK